MILPDHRITWWRNHRGLGIEPWQPATHLQPASYDVTLGNEIRRFRTDVGPVDLRQPIDDLTTSYRYGPDERIVILPGELVLGTTLERFVLPADLVGRLEGRSSIGRLGLTVHVTAGFIDPGFEGQVTMEIANLGRLVLVLYAGMRIGQMTFSRTEGPAVRPYGHEALHSKYQHQVGAQPSRIWQDQPLAVST